MTELLWAGSKYGSAARSGSGLLLRLGDETITASDHVHLLGVMCTLWTVTSLTLMLPVASGSARQVVISSSCHDIVAPNSVVGLFMFGAGQPGTRCQAISMTRRYSLSEDTFRRSLKTYFKDLRTDHCSGQCVGLVAGQKLCTRSSADCTA